MIRGLLRALVTIGLCLVAAEIGAAIYLAAGEGRHPWLAQPRPQKSQHGGDQRSPGGTLRLNPHCGYSGLPGIRLAESMTRDQFESLFGHAVTERSYETLGFNNDGFISLHDYPYADPTGQAFIIGMFGSSIVTGFSTTMEELLNELLTRDPRLANRKVVLLDFGNSATKQPENAACLAYYLSIGQHFDYVINLDGFPEVFIGWLNANTYNVNELMPFAGMVFGIQNAFLEAHGAFVGDDRLALLHARLSALEKHWDHADFALHALWIELRGKQIQKELTEIEAELTRVPQNAMRDFAMPLQPLTSADGAAIRERIVATWFNSSVTMAGMTRALNVPYLHVLEPNQYFTKAHFTDQQRSTLLNLAMAPVRTLVPEYYRLLIKRSSDFPRFGVDFWDASGLFDNEDASVFYDNCCHYSLKGDVILAHALAERILHGLDSLQGTRRENR